MENLNEKLQNELFSSYPAHDNSMKLEYEHNETDLKLIVKNDMSNEN